MTLKLWEVRNASGQFIGTYYGKSEKLVIQRAENELNAGAAAFRKSWTRVSLAGSTAKEIQPTER